MDVFLSWSGDRSKAVALAMQRWLPQVLQAVDPWISVDIKKGRRWTSEIAARLERSSVGVFCLTRDSLDSKWLVFEAGALSKTSDAYVCTFLLDVTPEEVEAPLDQFQHTRFERSDVEQLVGTINQALADRGEHALSEGRMAEAFDTYWLQLETDLRAIESLEAPWCPLYLHHVSLPVRDLQRSVAFYRDMLGLREVVRLPYLGVGGAWFKLASGQQLHLLENADGTFRKDEQRMDYRDVHFAVRVRDLNRIHDYLRSKGYDLGGDAELAIPRYHAYYVLDPDGHVIEINTHNTEEYDPPYV